MVFPAKKILRYIFALFFIITLNFFLPRAMPGDPVINLLGEDFIAGKEAVEKIREELGLNRPILVQYANYWKNLFQFDLGYSYHFRARVSSLIISRLKWTFILVAPSLILGTIIGALAGSLAGWKLSLIHISTEKEKHTRIFIGTNSVGSAFLYFMGSQWDS